MTDPVRTDWTRAQAAFVLESLVDRFTLPGVLSGLAELSRAKAAHLRTNWDDDDQAPLWAAHAATLEAEADEAVRQGLGFGADDPLASWGIE